MIEFAASHRTLRAAVRSRSRPIYASVSSLSRLELYFDELLGWRFANHALGSKRYKRLAEDIFLATVNLTKSKEQSTNELRLRPVNLVSKRWVDDFAKIANAIRIETGFTLRPNQIECALRLLSGECAELRTGEGKTLAAALAACAAASAGVPVPVVTVNDYLAKRDADLIRPIAARLGLSLGTLEQSMADSEKSVIYDSDIVYGTNKTFVFDFLRDRRENQQGRSREQARQMGQAYAIVDEADSVLIDDATVPMILSEPSGNVPPADIVLLNDLLNFAGAARSGVEYLQNREGAFQLTETGIARLGRLAKFWVHPAARDSGLVQLAETAISARQGFRRDVHYLVRNGEIVMIDQATGRLMPDRKWAYGLQQMIELKEDVEPTSEARTVGQITQQTYFRRYQQLSGLTGTAKECRSELWAIYKLAVGHVAPHNPSQLKRLTFKVHDTANQKWRVVAKAAIAAALDRAVLIGVNHVAESAALAEVFAGLGRPVFVLDAMSEAHEAELVAQAGQREAITIATHLAGRGTDIGLADAVRENGGLHVILASAMASSRLERQLYGRAGRQGDPGSFETHISLEDRGLFEGVPPTIKIAANMLLRKRFAPRWALSRLQAARDARTRIQRRRTLLREQDLTRRLGYS